MRASASVSYQRAAEDVKYATGMEVPKSVQQRLVHRQNFEFPEVQSTVEELSVDGGNIRIRTPMAKPCDWKGYKAVRLHNLQAMAASFQENNLVIDWVNNQPLASTLTCLGDGHDGIWNIIHEFTPSQERREILDWFHLMENLHTVKQIDRRTEISGAQWNIKNVPQVLAHRCAYLNRLIFAR